MNLPQTDLVFHGTPGGGSILAAHRAAEPCLWCNPDELALAVSTHLLAQPSGLGLSAAHALIVAEAVAQVLRKLPDRYAYQGALPLAHQVCAWCAADYGQPHRGGCPVLNLVAILPHVWRP